MNEPPISSHRQLIIDGLRSAPGDVRRLIKPLPAEALTWQNKDGWSITRVVEQLALYEPLAYQRLRHIVNADEPLLPAEAVSAIPAAASMSELLDRWQAERQTVCIWLASQSLEAWNRRVTHITGSTPDEKVALRWAVQGIIERDTHHLAWVLNIRQAWERQSLASTNGASSEPSA